MGFIRFMLAIAVLNSHFPVTDLPIVDGHEAVLAFFAISGFYMALILDTSYETIRKFYLGRFLTLYPMYVFALTISVALLTSLDVHPMTDSQKMAEILSDPASFLAMTWTSICIVGQELLFSLSPAVGGGLHFTNKSMSAIWSNAPLIQAWSLSLEILFYALAPFLVRLRSNRLIALVLISLCCRIAIAFTPMADIVFFKRFFPAEFWLFGGGILAYRLHTVLPPKGSIIDYIFFAALVLTILIIGEAPKEVAPFALPVAALVSIPLIFRGFRHFEFDRFVGKLSYPFYLLHFSAIAIFETYHDEPEGWYIVLATLVASLFTHSLFNTGIESMKRRLRRRIVNPGFAEVRVPPPNEG